jgi:hypothetical protein
MMDNGAQRNVVTALLLAFVVFLFAGDKVPAALAAVRPLSRTGGTTA